MTMMTVKMKVNEVNSSALQKKLEYHHFEIHSKPGLDCCLGRMITNLLRTELKTLPSFDQFFKKSLHYAKPHTCFSYIFCPPRS